jgi:histidinol-phosphate/aromatic aminotransferase/cobyric acid decarboxylase-like protein
LSFAVKLREHERALMSALNEVTEESGSHSPSRFTLEDRIPELEIKIDACFLSNPYATDLFIDRLTTDMVRTGELRELLEFYPSQNHHVASLLAPAVGVDDERIFVCNGAVEAIQAALHRFAGTRVAVILPTFSPYYEYLRPDQECFAYRLSSENDFELDCEDFIAFVDENRIDTVCLINPNNPNGGYVPNHAMRELLRAFADLELVILDESFVDFAYEDEDRGRRSLAADVAELPNVMLVKSMSKDFGIAGVRAGYAIASPDRIRDLVSNGYLWNISGLAEFFFRLFTDPEFQAAYDSVRLRYLDEAIPFFEALEDVDGLRAFSTKANFRLVQLDQSVPIELLVPLLLIRHGLYVRDCRDKVGLEDGQYLRISARKGPENDRILAALSETIAECRDLL